MAEALRWWGPAVLAWALLLTRRRGGDGARRRVRWVLLGLAVSLTALVPQVYRAIGHHTGLVHVARLLGHAGMLFAVWAAQDFMARMTGRPGGSRGQAWWAGGSFALLCLMFAMAPDLRPQSPWVLEYCVVYLVGQVPALATVIRLGLRHARLTRDTTVRVCLRLVVAGTVLALVYSVEKVLLTACRRLDFAFPVDAALLFGRVMAPTAHVLVLVGAALPAVVGWLRRYRLHRQLRPLWQALYRADPAIALDPAPVPDALVFTRLRLRLYRRVVEIRDGLLALQPYRDPCVAATARQCAAQTGIRGEPLEAAVEAAVAAAALRVATTSTATQHS